MEYMSLVFAGIGEFLMKMWSLEFVFLGIKTSVGAIIMFSGISAIVIKLIKG